MNTFKRQMREMKDRIKNAADAAGDSAQEQERDPSSVNIAGRSNIVVARNVGGADGAEMASGKQTIRIRQRDGKAVEETETVTKARRDANDG